MDKLFPRILSALVLTAFLSTSIQAASLQALLRDAQGQPLADAVVTLRGPLGQPEEPAVAIMDQVDKQFAPSVLVVRSGTKVRFPNSDNIRHQVYSFSPAKRFELRLYQGTPTDPVMFDKPGAVVLGCNIHDWMVGYIYVTDDPRFAVSDAQGMLNIDELPPGQYAVTLWHPKLAGLLPVTGGELEVGGDGSLQQQFSLAVNAPLNQPKAPSSSFGDAFRKAQDW